MYVLQTLIVEDEPLNREELRHLLSAYECIEVCVEAENAGEALIALQEHPNIDLVFLDIEMEEVTSGLLLADKIRQKTPHPYIIFVTAHPQYALESHDYAPLHYVTKPINEEKLALGVQRACDLIKSTRLKIKYYTGTLYSEAFVNVESILYVQKEKLANAVNIYLDNGRCLQGVKHPLKDIEQLLRPQQFVRAHNSFIVNLAFVSELRPRRPHDDSYCLVLNDVVEKIPVSKSRLASVRYWLERF